MVGKGLVLPSSFKGGPRYMAWAFQDAMVICQWYGPTPRFVHNIHLQFKMERDLISSRIDPRTKVEDRSDIVARVFNIKKKQLINDLRMKKIFGKVVADIHVVEFQKRGLPHAHILLTLAKEDKIVTPEELDDFICAEIPDKDSNPNAYEIVLKAMFHGPCDRKNPNSPCMVNGSCYKNFSKKFNSHTTIDSNGFPVYRPRRYGQKVIVRGRKIDNIDLLIKYNAHINVELFAKTKVIKYLFKYIHKGLDRSTAVLKVYSKTNVQHTDNVREENDEVKQYLDCRYKSAPEGGFYFVYGNGVTGKTYLWKKLVNRLRMEDRLVLSVASSGIAALLLPSGRIPHSRFKIPLKLDDISTCLIAPKTDIANLIEKIDLVIWDKASMVHRHVLEAVDRTFKDLLKHPSVDESRKNFGGKTFVLGGNFRQVLPVIPKAGGDYC
ncbi:uncharacterized protein LOC143885843 [Tasmannia lanceolata]|uniref:uncharacterized protein LOC143885843 n=1 Tax=Tasmannia lanceolata TaxID=3420 RepID=UPI004062C556